MANETTIAAEVAAEPTHEDYINAIQELKENTVSRDRYEALVKENKSLIQTLANGGTVAGQAVPQKRTVAEIKQDLWGKGKQHSQTEFMELVLELREAGIEQQGIDSFVAYGHHITPSAADYEAAERISGIYREALDYANGNDEVFINEISRRMVDTPMANINKIRR